MLVKKHTPKKKNTLCDKSPKVTVIIPVYNAEKYLADTLRSILSQTFTNFEVICIDDGSTDKSADILSMYEKKDKRIKVVKQENKGVIVARNNAVKLAKGEFIYFLDSDDVIDERLLEKSYNAIIEGKGDIITCRVMTFGRENGEMYLPKPTKFNMARGNCLVNAALLRKSLFDKSGGFDMAFHMGLEDYDFWLNMIYRQNAHFYRIPELLFYYRIKPKSESRNLSKAHLHGELMKRLYSKYPEMLWYKKLYKLSTFLFQIRRQPNKTVIRLLKLPIFSIRQKKNSKIFYKLFDLIPICIRRVKQSKIDEIRKAELVCKELNERTMV